MAAAVVALPAIGTRPTPAEMLAKAEQLVMGSPADLRAAVAAAERTDSPPTDGPPSDPLLAQKELVASLGKAVSAAAAATADAGAAGGDWLARREAKAQKMSERVKARKLAAEQAQAEAKAAEVAAKRKKREQVRRRAEKNLRKAEEATPTTALLGAVIEGQASGPPGVAVLKKEQRLWGGNNGKGQTREVLTRKLEAAKARQQAMAVRMKEQAKRQADVRTRLGAALALAENGTPGAMAPLEEALKAASRAELAEDAEILRAREMVKDAKQQAKAAVDAQAKAAAEQAARLAAQAAAIAAAEMAAVEAQAAAEAEAARVAAAQAAAQAQAHNQAQALAALQAQAAATPVRTLPVDLPAELDFRSPRPSAHAQQPPVAARAEAATPVPVPPEAAVARQTQPGAGDPRSKPLWQATEAELLAELLRRQQQPQHQQHQPLAVPPTAGATAGLVRRSPGPTVDALAAPSSKLPASTPAAKPTPAAAAPLQDFAKEQAEAEAAKAAEIKRKENLEKKLLEKAARAEERKREVDAKQKAKAEQAQARHEAAQARVRARKEAEAEASASSGLGAADGSSAAGGSGSDTPAAKTQPAGDTHAADMRRQMLQARAAGAAKKAKLAAETAAAEKLQKDATSVDAGKKPGPLVH
jgi:hypothetical protein